MRKRDKGFSLVELIVVILIMAILAITLAPQVMKWVDKSRQAKDASNYDALYSAAQVAATEYAPSETITIIMSDAGTDTSILSGVDASIKTSFDAAMEHALPDWKKIKVQSKEKNIAYTITVLSTAVVKTTVLPDNNLLED